ncbi:hypothetical protein [Priestia megaterium]|uniref:hypothetical protein n=1 Tax=Priestia megaterium TaxID=1404 RepID=UPI003CC60877
MNNDTFREIRKSIPSVKTFDDIMKCLDKIDEAWTLGNITEKQKDNLEDNLRIEIQCDYMEEHIEPSIDDEDWEDMCLFNPDLRD